jgi:shikimate dehydrogenase
MISAKTTLCAVIGDPVKHSLSPQIHNAAFREANLDLAYVAFHVKKGDLERAIGGVRSLGLRGLSVTIPHKVDILPYLDAIDQVAANIGSVNTVVNRNGHLTGYSTDGPGALRALEAGGCEVAGKNTLLLGSGGAARAIAFSLASVDPLPEVTILGIELEELAELEKDLSERTSLSTKVQPWSEENLVRACSSCNLIINATPIGMTPEINKSPVPRELLNENHAVFDIVYNPFETELLKDTKHAGARAIPGIGMFVQQAAIQFELWTGKTAPLPLMTETVTNALG